MVHLFNHEGLSFKETLKAAWEGATGATGYWWKKGTGWQFEGRDAMNEPYETLTIGEVAGSDV